MLAALKQRRIIPVGKDMPLQGPQTHVSSSHQAHPFSAGKRVGDECRPYGRAAEDVSKEPGKGESGGRLLHLAFINGGLQAHSLGVLVPVDA